MIIRYDAITGKRTEINQDAPSFPSAVQFAPISRFQVRAALKEANLLSQADAIVATASDLVQMAWKESPTFRRHSPAINAMAPRLGLSQADLDALWRRATEIEV